jgi:prefoldin subunit 5
MDEDQRTVSAGEVTVTKRLDTNRFNTPAVSLEITSTADRSTSVTVTEPIPDSFAIENVGFHPEFGSEHWSISEDQIVFDRTIDPGDEYITVYGVRNVTDDELHKFLDGETVVSTSDGVGVSLEDAAGGDGSDDPIEELLLEADDETVRDVITGEDDSLTEEDLDESEAEDVEEDTDESEAEDAEEDLDGSEAEDAEEDTDESEAEDMEEDLDESEAEDMEEDLNEFEAEDAEEDLDEFEAEDVEGDLDEFEAEDVEGDLDEFEAEDAEEDTEDEEPGEYQELPDSVAEALAREVRNGSISEENERILREAFSDSQKTRRDVDLRIKQLQTQVADLAAYTDEFERFLDAYGTGDNAFDSLEESLSDVASRVKELEDSLGAVNQQAAEIESKLEATRDELDARSEEVDTLERRVSDAETELTDVLYLEEEVMELEDQSETLSNLEETVETLDAEMERMKRFRDRLSSAFGPGGDRIDERDDE